MSDIATRISCPGFGILRDGKRFGLVMDMEFETGLMPIGGALHASARGISRIMQQFKVPATAFDPGAAAALRFTAPNASVQAITEWFLSRTERDLSIQRVLFNSLFEETGILTRNEARGVSEQFAGFNSMKGVSFRTNVWERDTLYLIELYRIGLPVPVMTRLRYQSDNQMQSLFRFVTADEILKGRTAFGTPINPVSKSLLDPQMPQKRR